MYTYMYIYTYIYTYIYMYIYIYVFQKCEDQKSHSTHHIQLCFKHKKLTYKYYILFCQHNFSDIKTMNAAVMKFQR